MVEHTCHEDCPYAFIEDCPDCRDCKECLLRDEEEWHDFGLREPGL